MSTPHLITDHIDLWTSTIKAKKTQGRGSSKKRELYGIKKLRELILELAVRGKLVPQDPSDEPASVLLKRIDAEKVQLIKSKKVKTQKSLPEITQNEKPFELPSGWEWIRLESISDINGGFAFKSSQYVEDGVRVIRISDFDEKGFKGEKIVRYHDSDLLDPYVLEEKNILMAMTGGTVGKSFLVDSLHEKMVVNQRVATIKISSRISSSFISCALQTSTAQSVIHEAKNSTNDNISMSDIKGFFIPTPSLKEQHRIVAKVDELMALCDELEQQTEASLDAHNLLVDTLLATLIDAKDADELSENWDRLADHFDTLITTDYAVEQLKQTILQLAVQGKLVPQDSKDESAGELLKNIAADKAKLIKEGKIKKTKPLPAIEQEEKPFDLPEGWVFSHMQDLCFLITDGTHQTPKYTDGGRPFISAQCVKPFRFLPENCRYVSEEHYQGYIKNRKPEYRDILLARVGAGIGEAAMIDTELEFAIYVSTGLLKPHREFLLPEYLTLWLNSPIGRNYSATNTLGKGVSQGNLNLSLIRAFLVSVPPLDEQLRIVAKVDQLMALCDQLKAHLSDAQSTQLHLTDAVTDSALVSEPNL